MTTAMAFAAFADAPVDVAVVEVGLGGAEDSTNVLEAGVCVITPIGLDHTEWLGDTIEDIAWPRPASSTRARRVICAVAAGGGDAADPASAAPRSARPSPARAASSACCGRSLAVGGQVLTLQGLGGVYEEVFLPLHGAHQAQNAAVALAAVEAFLGAGTGAAARPGGGPRGLRRGRPRPAGWNGSAARRRSCSTPRTTRPAWPRR